MTRKFFALLLVLSLLAGCGTAAATSDPETSAPISEPSSAPEAPPESTPSSSEPSSVPEEAPTETASPMEKLLASYYLSAEEMGTDFSLEDANATLGLWGVNGQIDETKLIPTFRTGNEGRDGLLELCQKLKSGENLHNLLQSGGRLYTVLTDSEGKDSGYYAIIDAEELAVLESGAMGLGGRSDFRSHDGVEMLIDEGNLDPDNAEMTYCVINNFSVGTLLWDGEQEYFIPSVESVGSMGLVRVGEIYPLSDIVDMIESNIDDIFPINEVDEYGNPYIGVNIG